MSLALPKLNAAARLRTAGPPSNRGPRTVLWLRRGTESLTYKLPVIVLVCLAGELRVENVANRVQQRGTPALFPSTSSGRVALAGPSEDPIQPEGRECSRSGFRSSRFEAPPVGPEREVESLK